MNNRNPDHQMLIIDTATFDSRAAEESQPNSPSLR
jgi:hypothetical protein